MTTEHELTADVVIVGAASVGLSLARDLSQRSLREIVAEARRF